MDWRDRIDNIELTIQTGDGAIFTPLWRGAEIEKEYNTSAFNFINVYGTLVDRKKPQGRKLPLVFAFQGADNIEQAQKFEDSADDPRPWIVTHPYYGSILGQPISIKRNDSSLNYTEITVPFWESIDADYPISNFSVKDNTRDRHDKVYEICALSFVNNLEIISADLPKWAALLKQISGDMESIQNDNTYSDFQNGLNKALKAIDSAVSGPLNAIQNVQNFIDLPATYIQAVKGRIASYKAIYDKLKHSINTLFDKKLFESMGGSLIASMSLTVVNPLDSDFVLVSDLFKISEEIKDVYLDYVSTLDAVSVSVYDVNNTFIPDASAQYELNSLVTFTVSNLYAMAFESKRERIILTSENTNVVLLVHRYLGLDAEDKNIEDFINTNEIRFNELFSIKKGREVRYTK